MVTFCRNSATPIAAEEGLTGIFSSGRDIEGYGDLSPFTDDEVCSGYHGTGEGVWYIMYTICMAICMAEVVLKWM